MNIGTDPGRSFRRKRGVIEMENYQRVQRIFPKVLRRKGLNLSQEGVRTPPLNLPLGLAANNVRFSVMEEADRGKI